MTVPPPPDAPAVGSARIARDWARLGITGFGGPPAHIQLLRRLCVTDTGWIDAAEFEDAIAACNLLPGPASTQLAIYCARRVGGWRGAIAGGLGFIVPGLVIILALSAVLLGPHPSSWGLGAAAGAGAVVPAVAVEAGLSLAPASLARARQQTTGVGWWAAAVVGGGAVAALAGVWVALALVGCGLIALARDGGLSARAQVVVLGSGGASLTAGTLAALAWTALKVGALSYGGGFVIIPLMQADAVNHHWLTRTEFLGAVALGQITPGPVVQTVAVVGYGAAGLLGGVLAAAVAFAPSFAFILIGGRHFSRLRGNRRAQAFLGGAGPAAIGAIIGASVPLALALGVWWQAVILATGAVALVLRRQPLWVILTGGLIGLTVIAFGGAPPH